MADGTCSVGGCGRVVEIPSRGLCRKHYNQWRKTCVEPSPCSVEDCENPENCRGLCNMHYKRAQADGTLVARPNKKKVGELCSIDGCGRPHKGRGFCAMHLGRLKRDGTPGDANPFPPGTGRYSPEVRFWEKVEKTDGCWIWKGAKSELGYGNFAIHRGQNIGAHRFAYLDLVGPIPDGLVLDHLCRNPSCVNPAHLEPVTHHENLHRGIGPTATLSAQTHCKRGHPLSGDNLKTGTRWRQCRECERIRRRERTIRDRAVASA